MTAAEIARQLELAQAALAAGDGEAAARALADAERACAEAVERGVRLTPSELETIQDLHRRGAEAAAALASALVRALEDAGSARRASAAYGR